jgi:cytoskeletal protein RodZ
MTPPDNPSNLKRRARNSSKNRPFVNLKTERQKRGLRKDDIRSGAQIPLKYIAMLETGQYPESPSPQFKSKIKSYRKSYLRYLGLPSNARLKFKKQSTLAAAVQEVTNIFSKTDALPQSGFLKTFLYSFIGIVLLLSLMRGITAIISNQAIEADMVTTELVQQEDSMEAKQNEALSQSKSPILQGLNGLLAFFQTPKTTDTQETKQIAAAGANQKSIEMRILEPIYLEVQKDGQTTLKRFVNPIKDAADKEFEWDYANELSLIVSDISSIAIKHNGQMVEPMGHVGTSRTITFRAQAKN